MRRFCCYLLFIVILGGLPSRTFAQEEKGIDPWEGFNRRIFFFNDGLDRYLLKPLAKGYRAVTPDPVENSITNLFSNLSEVRNVLNDVLQGKLRQAGNDSGRFLVNSTLGLVGLFDVAETMGLAKSDGEDFGQTLAMWGVKQGPYVVLPFFGPSNVRDGLGQPVDTYSNPATYIDHVRTRNVIRVVDLISTRANLLAAENLISGDKYIFIRDAYLQRRDYLILDGEVVDDFGSDFEDYDEDYE